MIVDIGITAIMSPASDIAALCLSSWLAAIFTQLVISDAFASYLMSAQNKLMSVK